MDPVPSELYIILAIGTVSNVSQKVCGYWTFKICPYSFKENSGFANFLRKTAKIVDNCSHSSRPTKRKGGLRRVLGMAKHPIER